MKLYRVEKRPMTPVMVSVAPLSGMAIRAGVNGDDDAGWILFKLELDKLQLLLVGIFE